ncbi:hypothetical protein SUGI_1027380 [Cryptomeria japonica]|nr:hypothetical protein SUGI_1027380 [Cryptomeria japonica]
MRHNSTDYSVIGVGVLVGGIMLMMAILLLYLRFMKPATDQHSPEHPPRVDIASDPASSGERGVEEAVIHTYPIFVFAEKHEVLSQQDRSCSICLEDYKFNEQLRMIMDCRHVYHVHCIDEWLTRHPSCPLCRNSP